ncbi:MAG: CDGSH iron-sulfur domain-containing protein [Mariprofundaceae bacterium]
MAKKIQTYKGKHITVNFDPNRCMHAGNCVRELPKVFKAESRGGWIFPDAADADVLADMVLTCPSGALGYSRDNEMHAGEKPENNAITIMPDGPLFVHAEMKINGEEQPSYRAALCRCGLTKTPPYCDNSHQSGDFRDTCEVEASSSENNISTDCCLEIQSLTDGPLLIKGGCELKNIRGELIASDEQMVLCRCGASANKPYCDGSHIGIDFKSD